jgi:hypothetical protein
MPAPVIIELEDSSKEFLECIRVGLGRMGELDRTLGIAKADAGKARREAEIMLRKLIGESKSGPGGPEFLKPSGFADLAEATQALAAVRDGFRKDKPADAMAVMIYAVGRFLARSMEGLPPGQKTACAKDIERVANTLGIVFTPPARAASEAAR